MASGYWRPVGTHRAEIEVLRSRFIATLALVETIEDTKARLASVASELANASHHAYAYVIGHGSSIVEGMSDAGEPSGTAGYPIMAVLRGSKLGDCIIIVTRYFGGTLLGTGGLVRAYTDAAKAVLETAPTEQKVERSQVLVIVSYSYYERLLRTLRDLEAVVDQEDFAAEVTVLVTLPTANVQQLQTLLRELTAGKAVVERIG
ncbi:MAG: YigZ family protein [Chloroflexota bacterium]|nr:YigZ family protein [Chloroflexota bacterium]